MLELYTFCSWKFGLSNPRYYLTYWIRVRVVCSENRKKDQAKLVDSPLP